jgi:hypothetical protein
MRATQSTQHAANLQPPLANPELQRRAAASVRQHTQAAERWCWSLGGLFFFRVIPSVCTHVRAIAALALY